MPRSIITGVIDIKAENVNQDVQIINSYENYNRLLEGDEVDDKDPLNDENEITNYTEIKIDNNPINFAYTYKFDQSKTYKIEYSFDEKLTKANCMFSNCELLTELDFSSFNPGNLIGMFGMFDSCSSLKSLTLSYFNTQNVRNMSCMFLRCESLKNLDLSNFNTQNVTDMKSMFGGCKSLENLNLSDFNTQNVINMGLMFAHCDSLTNLDLSNFNTQNVTNMNLMFYFCDSLKKENIINN